MEELATWARPEQTCLVMGAGASIPSGGLSGEGLIEYLIRALDPSTQTRTELALVAEILERKRGRRPLVEAVRAAFAEVTPQGGLRELPRYPWRAVFTTNYDNLFEAAAKDHGRVVAPIRSKYDLPQLEQLGVLPLFKIHGCLTQDRVFGDPSSLILTKEDYRRVRNWKQSLLRRMETELESAKVLIVGQSLSDLHLDELIDDVLALQDDLGLVDRVSLLLYSGDPELHLLYESRNISVTSGDIDWFASALAAVAAGASEDRSTIAPIPSVGDSLPPTLQPVTQEVSLTVRRETKARKMYAGAPASYFDIANGRTFQRDAVPLVASHLRDRQLAVILGAAGLGKTTMARQVLLARRQEGLLAWEHRQDLPLDSAAWTMVNHDLRETGRRGVLLLDNATAYQRQVNDLLRALGRTPERNLEVLVTAERHRWDRLAKHPDLLSNEPVLIGRLSEAELRRLLDVVAKNDDVRSLVPSEFLAQDPADQLLFLRRNCAGDIFICLRNIFLSTAFDAIVLEEFAQLEDDVQEVYQLVAGLEAISGGSHRQLIIRMLGLHHSVISRLLDDMEGLLTETFQSEVSGIFVWRTRHPEIADIVARYKFSDPDRHLELVNDLIENLNPVVDVERNAIRGFCNSNFGLDAIARAEDRLRVLEVLTELLPGDHVLRHRLVREFMRAGEYGQAEQVLEQAINEVGIDPPLLRYRIDLYRAKAKSAPALQLEDRKALLRWAWSLALEGCAKYTDNWFMFRSVADVALEWLYMTGEDALVHIARDEVAAAYDRLYEPKLHEVLQQLDHQAGMTRR